jgi:hypothetical protein
LLCWQPVPPKWVPHLLLLIQIHEAWDRESSPLPPLVTLHWIHVAMVGNYVSPKYIEEI